MSLYNDASLLLIPSGYKSGKLYSQKPTDGSGDLTFTRASDATRVNSDGLIEKVRTNLLLQSNTFDTTWISNNTTLTSGQSGYDGTNNAWSHIPTATNTYHRIRQSITTPVSTEINYSVYAKANGYNFVRIIENAVTGNFATFNLSTGVVENNTGIRASIENIGGGWYRCNLSVINSTATSRMDIYAMENASYLEFLANGTSGIYIQNAQAEISDFGATEYIPTTTAPVSVGMTANVPRLDYTNSSCPRLILEPQRTNLALYSEQFDNGAWWKNQATIVANDAISPDGTQNAELFYPTSSGSYRQVSQNISVTNGVTYSFSIFVKLAGLTNKYFHIYDVNNDFGAYFNIDNGTVANTQNGTATIENIGNGWYRCILISTATSTNTYPKGFIVTNSSANNSDSVTANGTNGFYIWGAQLEVGSYPTSYIPTLSTSVTRVADVCSKTGISSLIGQTEGAFMIDVNLDTRASFTYFALAPNLSSADNYLGIGLFAGSIVFESVVSASLQAGITLTNSATGRFKIAVAYKANDFVMYVNGTLVGTDTSGSFPTCSQIGLYEYNKTPSVKYNQALLFPTRLTNDELASLTTI